MDFFTLVSQTNFTQNYYFLQLGQIGCFDWSWAYILILDVSLAVWPNSNHNKQVLVMKNALFSFFDTEFIWK